MIEISGAVVIDTGKLLLLHKKSSEHFELPGGKVEDGETYEEAMKREVKEEIDCEVKVKKYLGYVEFVRKGKGFRSHMFLVELKDVPKVNEPEEFSKLIWMPLSEYQKFVLAPNVLLFCERFLE